MSDADIGLCLSGGGYRATLFHSGVLRRLNELGILSNPALRTITSVSGGSITSAFLATAFRWPLQAPVDESEWDERFSVRLRALTRRNIRTGSFLRGLLPGRSTVAEIAGRYDDALGPTPLSTLPAQFTICATDLSFGVNWEFRGDGMGSYRTGKVPVPGGWTLGRAVAASSCFPPVFQPLRVSRDLGKWSGAIDDSDEAWERGMADLRLSDGGVYDNMGIEPVWASSPGSSGHHGWVLVSDAGGLFSEAPDEGLPSRVRRYQAIQENQARSLRKRWLIDSFLRGHVRGAYWGMGSARERYAPGDTLGYSKELARHVIARIRTDLDAFSHAEIAVLENHGYLLADVAVRTHCAPLVSPGALPLRVPWPEWLPPEADERRIGGALAGSSERKKLGRR